MRCTFTLKMFGKRVVVLACLALAAVAQGAAVFTKEDLSAAVKAAEAALVRGLGLGAHSVGQ